MIEAGSLSAAGRRLGLSPAMVSKRLARLEARLGTRLAHRTTRRLVATAVGARFHEDVSAVLAAAREAEARAAGGREPGGRLRISAPTSFGRLHVAPHLKGFLGAYPRIELEFDLSDGFVDLVGERFDLAIRITAQMEPHLTAQRLAANRRILCASPAYVAEHGTPASVDELAGHRLLAASGQLPWRLEGKGEPVLVEGTSAVRTNSSEVVRELALAGVGIALRSTWDVSEEIRAGRLVRLLPDHEGATDVGIFACHPRATIVPAAVAAFIAHLRTVYGRVPYWDRKAADRSANPTPSP